MKRFRAISGFAGAVRLGVAPPEPWVPPSKGRAFFSWSVNLLDIYTASRRDCIQENSSGG